MVRDVPLYLRERQESGTPALVKYWQQFEELHTKKLWHQLTQTVLAALKDENFLGNTSLCDMYTNFIADFDHRINPLSLAEIGVSVAEQMYHKACMELQEVVTFLESIQTKVRADPEAVVLCISCFTSLKVEQAVKMKTAGKTDDEIEKVFKDITTLIKEGEVTLEKIDGVTPTHGRFYEMASNYYRLLGKHSEYYMNALRFLGCTDLNEIPVKKQQTLAFSLGLAALLADNVYNFGELLQHDVLKSLEGTPESWIVEMLYAFNSGDLQRFQNLRTKWAGQSDLASQEDVLRRKICLLCLMEMVFKRPAIDRKLSFDEIAASTLLPPDEVELLVMKALSLGLVKGFIDQVDRKAHLNWVQPRVLDREQLRAMREKLSTWCNDVKSLENIVGEQAAEILAT